MEIKAGMLCFLVSEAGGFLMLPGNENRIVETVRKLTVLETLPFTELPAWAIKGRDPLMTLGGPVSEGYCLEACLRPINDPGLETEDDVSEVLRQPETVR